MTHSPFRDGLMTPADFAMLCRTLFRNPHGKAYSIEKAVLEDMFNVFDANQVNVETWFTVQRNYAANLA